MGCVAVCIDFLHFSLLSSSSSFIDNGQIEVLLLIPYIYRHRHTPTTCLRSVIDNQIANTPQMVLDKAAACADDRMLQVSKPRS